MSDGRNRAASDTGETHWGSAGKHQLVGLRYPSRLGDGAPVAIDTGSTHWGAAGKRQLVKLRYSIWLGGWRPGWQATPAKRTRGQRVGANWSGYAIRPGWGMAPRQQSTPATRTRGQRASDSWSGYAVRPSLGDGAPAAIDTGDTHKGTAGRRQLVRLRYSIRLGTVRKQHRDYRRFWRAAGAFSCKNTPTAPQTTPLPQFFFTKSSRTAGRHSRKGSIPGNKRRQRGGFRPISAENRRRHTGVPAEYTAQENGNSTEK